MARNPELEEFTERCQALVGHRSLAGCADGDQIDFEALSLESVEDLAEDEVGYYFLISAAGLNRTSLKRAMSSPAAQIVQPKLRRAFAIKQSLPLRASFKVIVEKAVSLRAQDLRRKRRGGVEALLRERLRAEGIPVAMSPPVRRVPGLLITQRKPDGVYPDPAAGLAPKLLLEIKSVRRVADDIQKRLYEIAEASLEMKTIYGDLHLSGFNLESTDAVAGDSALRGRLRRQVVESLPVVVAFLICPRSEAEKYREGAEAFIDKVFFQEEVEDCIEYLRSTVTRFQQPRG